MTDEQKHQIDELRSSGLGYLRIAQTVGESINSVKSYCRRHGLSVSNTKNTSRCPFCGKPIKSKTKCKPRRFCSDACRVAWWKEHPDEKHRMSFYHFICAGCGIAFDSYGNSHRKYCSHKCYIAARYGKERGDE